MFICVVILLVMKNYSKKAYKKPYIESIEIDRDISLIMMTGETDPGGAFASGKVDSETTSSTSTATTSSSNFEQNPFGKK